MKIAVFGAAGLMAQGTIRDLADAPEVTEIVLVDLESTRTKLEERATQWCAGKATVKFADLNDPASVQESIAGCSALANCTVYRFNLDVMDACLKKGVHYVDMGGLFHVCRKQMELDEQWREAGLTAILGMGSAPGIVNVMSRHAVDMLDRVTSIKISDGIVNFAKNSSPLTVPYAIGTLLDEFVMNPYVFANGDWQETPPFSCPENIDFPAPVGEQTVFATLHSEVATIPTTFKDKGLEEMSFKLSLPKAFEEKLRFLVAMGFGNKEEIEVGGVRVTPRDVLARIADALPKPDAPPDDHKVLRVDVRGSKDGVATEVRHEMICHPYEPWGMGMSAHSVGAPVGIACRMLAGNDVVKRGALPAEACVPPEPFFDKLAERNLHTTVSVRQPVSSLTDL